MDEKCFWVYILECENGSYYTGYTTDLLKRFQLHVDGKASKYTRSFKPIKIAQAWKIESDKSLAMRLENQLKKLSRVEKEKMIRNPMLLLSTVVDAHSERRLG